MASILDGTIWRFLGEPEVLGPQGNIAGDLGRKHLAILAYLALHPAGVSRDEAAGLLWPDATLDRAKHSLRQCLADLRKTFGDGPSGPLMISKQRLSLDHAKIAIDAQILAQTAASETTRADELLDLCRGPFLKGFATRARPFDDWAAAQRARLGGLAEQALTGALARAQAAGNRTEVARLSAALIELGTGAPGLSALAAGAPEAMVAHGRARRRRRIALAAGAAAILIGAGFGAYRIIDSWYPPSIAVRPFQAVSVSPETAALAKGLPTNIEYALHGVSDEELLVVRAGSDAPALRNLSVTEFAHQLGVDLVMEGEVRVEGGKAEVKVKLLDGRTGQLVDADHVVEVAEQTDEVSKLEDELTRKIIQSLDIEINDAEWNRIALINDTASLEAWIAGNNGLTRLITNRHREVEAAENFYKKALTFDPEYVSAYRGLAWCEFLRVRHGWKSPLLAGPVIQRRMEEVLRRRPDDAMTINLRGAVRLFLRDYDGAIADGARAVADLPNSADVHALYAHTLTFVGEYEKARDEIDEALKRSPNPPHWYHWVKGRALRMNGQHDKAVRELELNLAPDQPLIAQRVELAAAYAAAGLEANAKRIAGQILRFVPTFTVTGWQATLRIRDDEPRERERQLLLAAGLPD